MFYNARHMCLSCRCDAHWAQAPWGRRGIAEDMPRAWQYRVNTRQGHVGIMGMIRHAIALSLSCIGVVGVVPVSCRCHAIVGCGGSPRESQLVFDIAMPWHNMVDAGQIMPRACQSHSATWHVIDTSLLCVGALGVSLPCRGMLHIVVGAIPTRGRGSVMART